MATTETQPPGGAPPYPGPTIDPAPDEGALDLHEGIRTPPRVDDPRAHGCKRWPESLRLLNHASGELVPGRCRATNLCPYCARLFAVETSEMLLLDALEDAPELYVVLTAREHLTRAECTGHLRHLRRVLRRRWANVRWAVTVEFQRRGALHLNLLVKGVPRDELEEFHAAIAGAWCGRVDAELAGQWSDVIADRVGVVRYLSLHFLKSVQAPAIGWRGHRYSSTRDYLVRPASELRLEARRSLRLKRLLHRGYDAELAELELQHAESVTWSIRRVRPGSTVLELPPRPRLDGHAPPPGVPESAPRVGPGRARAAAWGAPGPRVASASREVAPSSPERLDRLLRSLAPPPV